MVKPIRVYRFEDVPKEWQDVLCQNGGDEDWLAVVPGKYRDDYLNWITDSPSFGCCCVNHYRTDKQGIVREMKEIEREDYSEERQYTLEIVGRIKSLPDCDIYIGCHA